MQADTNYTDFEELPVQQGFFIYVKCHKGEKEIVLKALKDKFRDKKIYRQALKKEYEKGKQCDHQNIIKYLGFVETEQYGDCIELEYVECRTLKDYISEHHTDEERISIVEQLASVLQYISGRGIVHGGINCYNVLITKKGDRVKIVNFRVIRSLEQDDFEAVKYISPEQKDDSTVSIDQRADIYSLGIVLKELGFFPEYEDIIKKCTALGRNERYFDASEFLADFDRDDSAIHIDKKWIIGTAVVVVVGAIIYFIVSSGVFSKITLPSVGGEDTTAVDTVASSEIVPQDTTQSVDTTSVQQPDATPADSDPLTAEIKAGLDSVFAPYVAKKDEGLSKWELNGMKMQIKAYYRKLKRNHKGLSQEDQNKLDDVFSSYAKEKRDEFAPGEE